MAATIIKEDGSVVAGANCYFNITELRAYYDGHQYSAAVKAVTADADLIPAAITACRMVDSSSELRGYPVKWDQDMAWPRFGVVIPVDPAAMALSSVVIRTGQENVLPTGPGMIPADTVPKPYKKACMEMVRFVLVKDRDAAFDKPAVVRERVDVIEREYNATAGSHIDLIPEIVQRMIRPFCITEEDQGAPGGAGGAQAVMLRRG